MLGGARTLGLGATVVAAACGRLEFDRAAADASPSVPDTAPCAVGTAFDLTGLVGSWKFDEGQGPTAADCSSSHNDGTLEGNAAWTIGKLGNALRFDGTSAYVETATVVETDVTAYSIAAWFSTTSTLEGVVFANRGVTGTAGKSLTLDIGRGGVGALA